MADVYDIPTEPGPAGQESIINTQMFPDGGAARGGGKRRRGRPAVTREPTATEWFSQIELCKRAVQRMFSEYRQNIKQFKGIYGGRAINVPLLTRLIENKTAQASYRDPWLSVRPRQRVMPTTPEEILAAGVQEVYINILWEELGLKEEIRSVTRDSLMAGRGITTPGYNAVFDETQIISYHTPTAYRTSPMDYLLDIECTHSRNALYGIAEHQMSIEIAKARFGSSIPFQDCRYTKWVNQKLGDRIDRKNTLKQHARTIVYQVEDLLTNKYYFMTPGYNGFIDSFTRPYAIDGLTPEFLEPIPVPDEFECVAEATLLRPLIQEKTTLRNYMLQHWKKAIPKYIADSESFTYDEFIKLLNAEDMSVAFGDKDAVKMLEVSNVSGEMMLHEQRIDQDIRDMGYNEYSRGGTVPGTRTAYETSEVVAGGNLPTADLNDRVEKHCSAVAEKLLAIAAQFIDPEEMMYIVGVPANMRMLGLPESIDLITALKRAESRVTVHTGSMQPPNKQRDPQRALFLDRFLMWPEANRMGILEEQARLLDFDPKRILKIPGAISPEEEREAQQQALMRGVRGRSAAGQLTGSTMGSRTRPEMQTPGGM